MLKPKELGQLFLQNYPVDKNGYSNIAYMDDLIKICPDFKTKNGCTWARSNTSWLGKQYKIERIKKNGCIYSVQLIGFNVKPEYHNIPPNIRNIISKNKCQILNIGSNIEIDHKDARYETESTSIENFQALNKTVNDAKRQHCKKCKETGVRFDAKVLGSNISYYLGNANSCFCEGCYWYDPVMFWKKVTKKEVDIID